MKKILALILASLFVMSITACSVFTSEKEVTFTFQLNEAKDGYILTGVENAPETVEIPSEYEGLPVTEIATHAFMSAGSIKKLTLPATVKIFQKEACKGLAELETLSIADLKSWCDISIASNNVGDVYSYSTPMAYAEKLLVGDNEVTELVIPVGVTKISAGAFMDAEMLTSITLPEGLLEIGNYAFKSLYNIKEVTIPDSVTSIGDDAFAHCEKLSLVRAANPDVLFSKDGTVFSYCNEISDFFFTCNKQECRYQPMTTTYHFADATVELVSGKPVN